MELLEMFRNASLAALAGMLVSLLPAFAGIAYAIRPTEQRLALMRPLSLASLFSGLAGVGIGLVNVLRYYWMHEGPLDTRILAVGAAEALTALVLAFGALTFAWLCVAARFVRPTAP